jgi:hypothetical protein
LARCLDVYRVAFAWHSHRKLALERLTVQGVFAATDRLAWCLAALRRHRTTPTDHSNPLHAFTPRLSNIPDCDSFHVFPATRFGESPFVAYRTPPTRPATTSAKIYAAASILGISQGFGAPRSKSAQPLLRPSRISPARLALEFFILVLLGRHLARCLIPQPRLCWRGLHFAQRSPVAIAGNLGPPETRQCQCLGGTQ